MKVVMKLSHFLDTFFRKGKTLEMTTLFYNLSKRSASKKSLSGSQVLCVTVVKEQLSSSQGLRQAQTDNPHRKTQRL
jgi:hypothetical protein